MAISMRKNPSYVKHTLKLIDIFHSFGTAVNVKTLVTKVNYKDTKNIGKLLENKPIKYWSLLEFNPINRGEIHKDKYYLTTNQFDKVANKMISLFPNLPIRVRKFRSNPESYCFIAANGEVYTFNSSKGDVLIGDLKKDNLNSIIAGVPKKH
jgi:MoaA/NifB/PqqE/SkfB family radical SAM enzyme